MGFGSNVLLQPGSGNFKPPIPAASVPPQLILTQLAAQVFTGQSRVNRLPGWGDDLTGLPTMLIANNEAVGVANEDAGNMYDAVTFSDDQYSSVTIGSINNVDGALVGALTRANAAGACYLGGYLSSDTGSTLNLFISTGGAAFTEIGVLVIPDMAEGDILTLVSEGSRHTMLVNGVGKASWYDATLTSGFPGISSGGPTGESISFWTGGNATTGPVGPALATDPLTGGATLSTDGQPWAIMANYPAVDIPIVSDQMNVPSGSHHADIRADAIWKSDHWSQCSQGSTILVPGSGGFIGLLTRIQPDGISCYLHVAFAQTEVPVGDIQYSYDVYRLDNVGGVGQSTWLAGAGCEGHVTDNLDPIGTEFMGVAFGDRLSFRADGCEIFAVNDNTYAGGVPGVMLFPPSTAGPWQGGNV